jgi:DNA-binding GntR family transcriptional regulator
LYVFLKEQILSHSLAAGDKINIDQLAKELEISNIPIREALSRLAAEGFVKIVPFKGMFVSEMNLQDVDEIFEIRQQLEILAVKKAVSRIPENRLLQLRQKIEEWKNVASDKTVDKVEKVAEMNLELHGLILAYSGNKNLENLVRSFIDRMHRYITLIQSDIDLEAEIAEHEWIVKCLEEKNVKEVEAAIEYHLQKSIARIRNNFKSGSQK